VAAVLIAGLLAAACTATGHPGTPRSSPSGSSAAPSGSPSATAGAAGSLQISPAAYQLPAGISREVLFATGRNLLIAGGLTPQGGSTAALRQLNPVTGATTRIGRLAAATHDAAGAAIGGGRLLVFGGGQQASVAGVQAITARGPAAMAGQLPGPRSDLSAVTVGGTAYLLGGYDGTTYDAPVLATTDGQHFRTVARLPVPVRYAAVTAVGNQIYVFGGQTPTGITNVIQRVTLPGGKAVVAGRLPRPMTGGSAFTLGGTAYVAGGQVGRRTKGATTSASSTLATSSAVLSYRPPGGPARVAGRLPVPVANAAVAVLGSTAFLVGGTDGTRAVPAVTQLHWVSASNVRAAADAAGARSLSGATSAAAGSALAGGSMLASQPWLAPARGRGHLAPGSNPSALPGDILIADNWNNRLLIVDPKGRIRWQFPQPGDLAPGQTFKLPDDAFFSPGGRYIIATEEEDSVVTVISIAKHKIIYRYGTPGVPGSTANHVSNPDDAMMLPGGLLLSSDIKNCRLLVIRPPAHHPRRVIGQTGSCGHNPPYTFGSPNGAFPTTNGRYIVTEINGSWANEMTLKGHVYWSVHPPGVAYPSDTNQIYPGRYLTADYSSPGQVVEFNSRGKLLWRFGGLNQPSLALPLPNGDILVNDDFNDRVIVIDPTANRIVWQYGHTGKAGTAPGYLNDPDGVDVTPPDSMLMIHGPTMGRP
jgi:hypothetical protein